MPKDTFSRCCRHTRLAASLFKPQARIFLPHAVSQISPVSATDNISRKQLRKVLRDRRRALSMADQKRAAIQLVRHLLASQEMLRTRNVALYLANDGELDPSLLIAPLSQRGIKLYLPVLRPLVHNRLWFVCITPTTRLVRNRFGIWEPDTRMGALPARRLPAWAMGMILMPLVGFDNQGGRLGMGGGFYDRSLEFTRRSTGPRPRLIGIAHACQEVDKLETAAWDIPLDGVLTER